MIYYLITAAILAADIFTKHIAAAALAPAESIALIPGVFHLTYVENRGIAWGMFSGGRAVFVAVSIIALILLTMLLCKTPKKLRTIWLKCGMALVFGGALGNMIDRIFSGYVVDFLDFRLINFPVFNVADIAVCTGVAMLLIHLIFAEDRARCKEEAKGE